MTKDEQSERGSSGSNGKHRTRIAEAAERLWELPDEIWDVVIVGSGYGGAAAAAAFAGLKTTDEDYLRVCVLERGQEYLPADFPNRFAQMPQHAQLVTQQEQRVSGESLFDFRAGSDVCALVANGLGGGSLINAGVLVEPNSVEVGTQSAFGRTLVDALKREQWYERAKNVLGGQLQVAGQTTDNTIARHPNALSIRKGEALHSLSGENWNGIVRKTVPISVAMVPGANSAGIRLEACTLCGDCMTGCHQGAKDSLDNNLLVLAKDCGKDHLRIFTGTSVLALDPPNADGCWLVHTVHSNLSLRRQQAEVLKLKAKHVVLAAGTLGTNEILLRSRSAALQFSPTLGAKFSCNGDNLAALYGLSDRVNGCADEDIPARQREVGPTITREIQVGADVYKNHKTVGSHLAFRVQEFAVPGPIRRLFEEIVSTSHSLHTVDEADSSDHGAEAAANLDPLAVNPDQIDKTLLVGVIGHDAAKGVLQLDAEKNGQGSAQPGKIRIHWPDARYSKELDASEQVLKSWASSRGAKLLPNPLWKLLPGDLSELVSQSRGPVLTVHPLGGCAASESSELGVVDEYGRVWDPKTGEHHKGIAVLDGSVFGHSLGANPALSIAAFALRASNHLAMEWWKVAGNSLGKNPADSIKQAPAGEPVDKPTASGAGSTAQPDTEVQIIERMQGQATLLIGDMPQLCMLELTLAFKPIGLRALARNWGRRIPLTTDKVLKLGADEPEVKVQVLRAYALEDWDTNDLANRGDEEREQFVKLALPLTGHMALLDRESSTPWQRRGRALRAWLCNRGIREFLENLLAPVIRHLRPEAVIHRSKTPFLKRVCGFLRLATRAGETRLLAYNLQVANATALPAGFKAGQTVCGLKRLTYDRRANPWTQLMQMKLTAMPNLLAGDGNAPLLTLDARFLARHGVPLMRITRQANQAQALLDLLSFGLYMARLLIHIHLWTFRRSDLQASRAVQRLPGAIRAHRAEERTEPEITELTVDHIRRSVPGQFSRGDPVKIRLSRYPNRNSEKPALVMIHGYSVSGNTFTHAAIPKAAAEYFWQTGRDVWILDLRSSTGLPTSTYPWSMEQVALVDIPAALLHVRQLTGQPVDVVAHCIGCAMFSMAMLSRASEVKSDEIALGVNDWLTEAHLGTLDAFHGPLGSDTHPTVNRVVLSQKGPTLRYTEANIFRAFVMQTTRRWLFNDVFSFQPPPAGGVVIELLDRLLASLPYPPADYDAQFPINPFRRTPWTQSRRRMDLLYGRDFNAENLRPETLGAIDDLFGPMHLDTVAQTIHFARFNVITNQRGMGDFFTSGRLRERWNVNDTFAFHGRDNGLVDASTNRLLAERFATAGVPLTTEVFEDRGHQDVFIGMNNARIYGAIDRFLASPKRTPEMPTALTPPQPGSPRTYVGLPWIGPRLSMPGQADPSFGIAAKARPDQGKVRMVLVPVKRSQHSPSTLIIPKSASLISRDVRPSREWHFCPLGREEFKAISATGASGCLVLFAYDASEVASSGKTFDHRSYPPAGSGNRAPGSRSRSAIHHGGSLGGTGFPLDQEVDTLTMGVSDVNASGASNSHLAYRAATSQEHERNSAQAFPLGLSDEERLAVESWCLSKRFEDVETAFVSLTDMHNALGLAGGTAKGRAWLETTICFALGSCQYPPGMLDADLANASLSKMASSLGNTADEACAFPHIAFAVFAGDQIYADASAGLADAVRRDERFHLPHERALRQPGLRSVLRRVPAAMLLDDHEISDNWTRLPGEGRCHSSNDAQRDRGLRAFLLYQRMDNRVWKSIPHLSATGDTSFEWGGLPMYLLDTRSEREPRRIAQGSPPPQLISETQKKLLETWLEDHKDRPKCIVTSSLFLPRKQAHLSGHRSDAFDGYLASMGWLIDFLMEKKIKHTLFLSGDEHHSSVCEASVADKKKKDDPDDPSLKLVSIHSSALYAPYPFANGKPGDMLEPDEFKTPVGDFEVSVKKIHSAPGDGFARIAIKDAASSSPMVTVWFHKADGCQRFGPFSF